MHTFYSLLAIFILFSGLIFAEEEIIVSHNDLKEIDKIIHELLGLKLGSSSSTSKPFKDCTEIKENGFNKSGVYEVQPTGELASFEVYCDMETDGGGWTVFQRRGDFGHAKDYFLRSWHSYSDGFGDLNEDFWLGNDKIHSLTNQGNYSLRIDMKDLEGNRRYAQYKEFKIGSNEDLYQLRVAGYSGDAGDSLTLIHNNMKFSTIDRDNDSSNTTNCASHFKGAWWYNKCYHSNLNGLYLKGPHTTYGDGVEWAKWKGIHYSIPDVEMKLKENRH